MANERTPLTSTSNPPAPWLGPKYSFTEGPRAQERKIRQLQCCICAVILAVFVIAIAIAASFSFLEEDEPNSVNNDTIGITTVSSVEDDVNNIDLNFTNIFLMMHWPIEDENPQQWHLPQLTPEETSNAVSYGKKMLGDREIYEENMSSPVLNSPSYKHQRAVSTTTEARLISKRGFVEDHATRYLLEKYKQNIKNHTHSKMSRWSIGTGPETNLTQPRLVVRCEFNLTYRTANGTCNNKYYPLSYGVAMNPFRRAMQPDYSDGVSSPRSSKNGIELPSAREISLNIHRPSYATDPNFTVMLAVWGQFLDHDITATALNQGENGKPIECCDASQPMHPECFPVPLSKGDPYFEEYNMTCMNFVRSAPAPTGKFGPRQQLNQATAFIDGSVVYGSNDERMNSLRLFENGFLKMFVTPDNRTLLPLSKDLTDGCNEEEMNKNGKYCFESGDSRANENLHLTSMHLLWARHHNFLAQQLKLINPEWLDEKLFQEARKILGAQMQHITYNEFLPIVLGKSLTEQLNISLDLNSPSRKDSYNASLDASIANSFAAFAFRFAHTLLPGLMKSTKDINNQSAIELHTMLFNPYSLYKRKGLDDALGGAINTQLAKSDQYFTNELSEKLFQNPQPSPGHLHGLDLVSLNIQRGRDHGLASYSEWRQHCHLPATDTWEQLARAIDPISYNDIKNTYNSPSDIDVYTGALSEPPVTGAITGPLLSCLISDQFVRIKFGDSHWYERSIGPQKFTQDQLNEIRKTSLASIICLNSDDVQIAPNYLMQVVSDDNRRENCTKFTSFNFEAWRGDGDSYAFKLNSPMSKVKSIIRNPKDEDERSNNDIFIL